MATAFFSPFSFLYSFQIAIKALIRNSLSDDYLTQTRSSKKTQSAFLHSTSLCAPFKIVRFIVVSFAIFFCKDDFSNNAAFFITVFTLGVMWLLQFLFIFLFNEKKSSLNSLGTSHLDTLFQRLIMPFECHEWKQQLKMFSGFVNAFWFDRDRLIVYCLLNFSIERIWNKI